MQKGLRFGEYVLLEKLGDGGMGEVWKAEHARMLRIEALKFLRDGAELRPEAKQRFLREAILQSRFQHPNIVAVYNAFEQDGASCIAMQFVDGESLEQRLHRLQGQLMPLPEVLEIATGVLAALEYAHTFRDLAGSGREGVIHRDVKPSNILLDRSGRALLTDFGIAFALDSNRLTQAGTTLGTVFYMSPEQIQEPSAVNVQSDIYSFGCVLYELLAGRPPFGAETDTDFTIKSMHVREMPKPLRLWNQDVPFDFEWIVYKALNKDQAMRFSSCAEMSRALTKAFVAHQAAETNAPAPTPKNGTVEQPAWEAVAPLIKGPQPPPAAATAVYTTPIASSTALLPVSSAFPPLTEKQVGRAKPILPRPLLWIGLAALLLLGVAVYVLKDALFGPSEQIVLVLKGSTSVGDELAPKMVEAFLRDELKATKTGSYIASKDDKGHPFTHIWGVVPGQSARQVIEIYATGSGDAFKCLAAAVGPKHCDLGMSSRPFSDKDRSDNPSLGNLNNPANEHIIALDGIAVIVNPANPVGRLSMQQLREIYTGQTVNWKQVGGDDAPIELYGRDQASGTREMFEQMVVGKDAQGHPRTVTVPGGHQLGESTAMVDAVLKSPNALGYVSSPLARDAKKLAISDGSAAALRPTMLAIVSEDYPIGRRLFLYEPSNPTPMAQSFVRYAVNAQGQAVVSEAHYIGLTPQAFPVNDVPPDAPSLYKDIASRYAKLGLSFRFASGKASLAANPDNQLDNLARDNLARLEAFLAQHPGVANNLLLIGFADNVGGAGLNDALAHNRANTIANSLKEDDVRVPAGNVRSLGLQMPVASNETSEGKSRNRRVEVWVPKGTD